MNAKIPFSQMSTSQQLRFLKTKFNIKEKSKKYYDQEASPKSLVAHNQS